MNGMPADYDAWKLDHGYENRDAEPCVFCKGDAYESVDDQFVCIDCSSEEPDEQAEEDGAADESRP